MKSLISISLGVALLATSARAQEESSPVSATPAVAVPPAADPTDAKRKELRRLVLERDAAAKTHADAVATESFGNSLVSYAAYGGMTMGWFGIGMTTAARISTDSTLALFSGIGCASCGVVTLVGALVGGFLVPKSEDEAAALNAAQQQVDSAAMAF